jgi:membrane protease YdiL (CAAX protease family)
MIGSPRETRTRLRNLILFVFLFFTVWTIRATVLYPIDDAIKSISPLWREVYALMLRLLFWIAPVLIYLKVVDKVDGFAYLRLNTPIDRNGLLAAGTVAVVFLALCVGSQYVQAGARQHVVFDAQSWTWYILLLSLPIAPISEEILFRGFILRKCQDFTSFWPANLINGLLFVAIHWPYWLYFQGFSADRIMVSVSILAVGLIAGYLAEKTGSLWPGIIFHLLNNFISITLIIR